MEDGGGGYLFLMESQKPTKINQIRCEEEMSISVVCTCLTGLSTRADLC